MLSNVYASRAGGRLAISGAGVIKYLRVLCRWVCRYWWG